MALQKLAICHRIYSSLQIFCMDNIIIGELPLPSQGRNRLARQPVRYTLKLLLHPLYLSLHCPLGRLVSFLILLSQHLEHLRKTAKNTLARELVRQDTALVTLVGNFAAHGNGIRKGEQTLLGDRTAELDGVARRTEFVREREPAKGALGLGPEARCHAGIASQMPTWYDSDFCACHRRPLLATEFQFNMANAT